MGTYFRVNFSVDITITFATTFPLLKVTILINLLFRSVYIARIVSGLLLTVFILGITPKRILHDVFAKHTDINSKKTNTPLHITTSGYNCDRDNLVAESIFVNDLTVLDLPIFHRFSNYLFKNTSFSSISEIYSSHRGPPVNS